MDEKEFTSNYFHQILGRIYFLSGLLHSVSKVLSVKHGNYSFSVYPIRSMQFHANNLMNFL
jgi:hypothetical protein